MESLSEHQEKSSNAKVNLILISLSLAKLYSTPLKLLKVSDLDLAR